MRNTVTLLTLACITIGLLSPSFTYAADTQNQMLWYQQPAQAWTEALPVGNGRLGAMVFGGREAERIQFNEDSLWTGHPEDYQHPGAKEVLPTLRQLLFDNQQKQAEALAMKEFMSVPLRQEAYQPFGSIQLDFPDHAEARDYRRSLDLDTATSRVTYRVGNVRFVREVFASYPDNCLVVRLSADRPGQLNFNTTLTSLHPQSDVRCQDHRTLCLSGRVTQETRMKVESRMRFASQLRVYAQGGQVSAKAGHIEVANGNEVMLILVAATSYVNYSDISADPIERCVAMLGDVSNPQFPTLHARHVKDHQTLYRRVFLGLKGSSVTMDRPTDQRILAYEKDRDPQLDALCFHYGRYLLIASSRTGGHAANLQGLWNDKLAPSWDSKYTVNINTEMNYWPAELTNLSECHMPLFDMLEDCSETGAHTAQTFYGAPGWVLHHNTDGWRGTAPINNSNHGIWPTGGAWLCQHLWWHYSFSLDETFLRQRAYPTMKQAAEFFVHTLVEDPRSPKKWLISGPSNSPENGGLVMGPTMDHQIIRNLFANCIEASRILNTDATFRNKLENMITRIAPNQIGKHGQLQEWLEDKDNPKNTHRHVSHLWGLHPGAEINEDTPDLWAAARQSLEFRGDGATGWSMGWKVNFWARLKDGDHAHILLGNWLKPVGFPNQEQRRGGGVYPNLFDAHPPFQIDGNFGVCAGIGEMLVQSHRRTSDGDYIIDVLPALPTAWSKGSVAGLRARGGFEVDIDWTEGILQQVTLTSKGGARCMLAYGGKTKAITVQPGENKRTQGIEF